MATDKQKVTIEIEETLDLDQQEELVFKFEEQRGIAMAVFNPENPHELTIEYDPEFFSHTTLCDFIAHHGYHPKIKA